MGTMLQPSQGLRVILDFLPARIYMLLKCIYLKHSTAILKRELQIAFRNYYNQLGSGESLIINVSGEVQ